VYFWVSAHFQKHFIRIGDGKGFFNQAMLNQNVMIRRYLPMQTDESAERACFVFDVSFAPMLTRFLNAVISLALTPHICF